VDGAIEAREATAELAREMGQSVLAPALNNIGNGLRLRHARTGRPTDLERAIDSYGQAITLTRAGDAELPRGSTTSP
jgi:hypothetical protein